MDHPLRWSSDDYGPIEARSAWLSLFSEKIHEVVRDPGPPRNPFRARIELYTLEADYRELRGVELEPSFQDEVGDCEVQARQLSCWYSRGPVRRRFGLGNAK